MKKFFVMLLTSVLSASAFALPTRGFVPLTRVVVSYYPGTGRVPKTEPIALFSAFQTLDEIVISSEEVSAIVTISVYNEVGNVVETKTESFTAGGEISLDITDLPSGMYILEISFDDTVYVGQFEL